MTVFTIHCRKCKRELVADADMEWTFVRHFMGRCLEQMPPNDMPEPAPDWLKEE
jgi:hypothetical protein